MTILIPAQRSHCGAVSREEPVPFRWPETITSKFPFLSAFSLNTLNPLCIRPAYAFFAISAGSWSKQTHAGVMTSVLMSSSKSSTDKSSIFKLSPLYSCCLMSSRSLVRKRTLFSGLRAIFAGGQLSLIAPPQTLSSAQC